MRKNTEHAIKYLTKKRSIELCREMWAWIAAQTTIPDCRGNGDKFKMLWPGWEAADEKYGHISLCCFACHYTDQHTSRYSQNDARKDTVCKFCPLIALWPRHYRQDAAPCTHSNTAYRIWLDTVLGLGLGLTVENSAKRVSKAQAAAQQIVDHCDKLLERYKK